MSYPYIIISNVLYTGNWIYTDNIVLASDSKSDLYKQLPSTCMT